MYAACKRTCLVVTKRYDIEAGGTSPDPANFLPIFDALVDIEGNIPPANVRSATSYCFEARMSVVECDVPSESALGKALIERADFS
jgi:hypothetical protein